MKKMIKMFMMGGVALVNMCAMTMMISSVNSACIWLHHQPEVPEEAKSFRKF